MKEFSRRSDLTNETYLSVFLGVFARIVKVTDFAQVINFREWAHGKILPSKIDKNNRESKLFLFCFVFNTTAKQSLLSLFQNNNKDKKFIVPSFCSFCFLNGLFTHALAKCVDRIIILNIDQISLRCAVIATWLVTSGIIQLYWHFTFEFLDIRGHCRYTLIYWTRGQLNNEGGGERHEIK